MPVPSIGPVPPLPSRSTQSQEEFNLAVDSFFIGVPVLREEMNASIDGINDAVVTINVQSLSAAAAADRAEAAAAFRTSIAFKSWAELSALAGTYSGQTASVFDDGGTHTDPVVGGTVDNEGIYRWSTAPAGWEWVSDGIGATVAWGDISGKPSTFAPAAHTHAISEVSGLTAALGGKASTGAATASGITMATGKLLGRSTAATGAIEEIALGPGLSFDGLTLNIAAGGSMVYPASGIAVSSGSGWGSSLAAPTGDLVGTSGAQTLTNKTLGTGTVYSGGSIQGGVTVSDTGSLAVDSVGFRGVPRISATTRTIQASDDGKMIVATSTVTLPSGLPIGFACLVHNNSSSNKTIAQGSGATVRLAGSASTGSRTLAQRGLATAVVVDTNVWVVGGNVT